MKRLQSLIILTVVLLLLAPLAGCQPAATPVPTKAPTQAPAAEATKAPPTQVPPTATPVPPTPIPGPAVGGTVVMTQGAEPDSLDITKTAGGSYSYAIMSHLGGTLVIREPLEGKYVPYLAESWTASEDGLVWDFKLKKGIKFHDGSPLTAQDYAWTFQRAIDPALKSPGAGPQLAQMASAEALDDLTLRITLKAPYFPFLLNLSTAFLQPLSQAAVEKAGDQYGRHPIGVGPYKFKEWQTGARVVLERNPDFNWGPDFAHQGAPYIQTVEFRIITETSTALAGLEAGELDYGGVLPKDAPKFQDPEKYQSFEYSAQGLTPYLSLNVSKPPFDDLRVRQAFNLAIDREAMIKVILQGQGVVQYGPISPTVAGYWPGVEKIGYGFDLPRAKALMQEAGYTEGPGGMLQKDGQPLKLALKSYVSEVSTKVAEIAQEQYKALGVDLEIKQQESGIQVQDVFGGNYEIAVFGMNYPEADLMHIMYHSSNIGAMNCPQVNDPELDKLLDATRTAVDPVKRQEACDAAQKYIVENALVVPLFAQKAFAVLSSRVHGTVFSPVTTGLYWFDAYIETQ